MLIIHRNNILDTDWTSIEILSDTDKPIIIFILFPVNDLYNQSILLKIN